MKSLIIAATFLCILGACGDSSSGLNLADERWRIAFLYGRHIGTVDQEESPFLMLRSEDSGFSASVGCNHFSGSYERDGSSLSFGLAAVTRRACGPPLDEAEELLARALSETARWTIDDQVLRLFDEEGEHVANLLGRLP